MTSSENSNLRDVSVCFSVPECVYVKIRSIETIPFAVPLSERKVLETRSRSKSSQS